MDNHKQKTLLTCILLVFLLYVYWPSELLEENYECSLLQSVKKELPILDLNSKYCRQCSSDASSSISVLHLFAALKNGCRQLITIQNGRQGLMTIQNGCQSLLGKVEFWWQRWDILGCKVMVLDETSGKFEEWFLCDEKSGKKIGNSVKVVENSSKSGNSEGRKSVNNFKIITDRSKKSGKSATKTGKKSASSVKKTDNNVKKLGRSVKKSGGHVGKKSGGKKAGKSGHRKHGNSARKQTAKKSGNVAAKTGNIVQAQRIKTKADQKNELDSSGVVEDGIHGNIDSKSGDDDEDDDDDDNVENIQEGEEEDDDEDEESNGAGGIRGEEAKDNVVDPVDSEEKCLNREDETNDNYTVDEDKDLEEEKEYGADARSYGNKQDDITDEDQEGDDNDDDDDDEGVGELEDDDDEGVGEPEDDDGLKKEEEDNKKVVENVDDVDKVKSDEEKEEHGSTSLAYFVLFPLLVISTGASVLELLREKKKERKVSEEGTDDANEIATGCSVGRRMSLVDLTVSRHARKEHQIENILKHSGVSTTARNNATPTPAPPLLRRSSLAEGLLQGQPGGHLQGRPLQQRQLTWSPPSPLVRQAAASGRRTSVDYDMGSGGPAGDESPDSRRRVRIIRRH